MSAISHKSEIATIFINYYSKILSTFFWVSVDAEKPSMKHGGVFNPLSFVPDKEEFSFIWI